MTALRLQLRTSQLLSRSITVIRKAVITQVTPKEYHDIRQRNVSVSATYEAASTSSSSSSLSEIEYPLHRQYQSLVNDHIVQSDVHQLQALDELERLRNELLSFSFSQSLSRVTAHQPPSASLATHLLKSSWSSLWTTCFPSSRNSTQKPIYSQSTTPIFSASKPPRGIYLYGGVGCGKTLLANIFYESLESIPEWKHERQKHHFHQFMLGIHQEMHRARTNPSRDATIHNMQGSDAILPTVVEKTLQHGRLVYLDEFQVTDVADALILQRLFTGLWKRGAVVVATSNRPPAELYLNGIQRDRFLPFIDLIERRCVTLSMMDADTDYRLVHKALGGDSVSGVYYSGEHSHAKFNELFDQLVNGACVGPSFVATQGRQVAIPLAVRRRRIARFSFANLCQQALGAADYLAISRSFHIVFVDFIPTLTIHEINWVRRFIIFVDVMYESKVKLILHAVSAPSPSEILDRRDLVDADGGKRDHDEFFAFDRTVSRLNEMQSKRYLQLQQRVGGSRSPSIS